MIDIKPLDLYKEKCPFGCGLMNRNGNIIYCPVCDFASRIIQVVHK